MKSIIEIINILEMEENKDKRKNFIINCLNSGIITDDDAFCLAVGYM